MDTYTYNYNTGGAGVLEVKSQIIQESKIIKNGTMGWPGLTSRAEKRKRKVTPPIPSTPAQTD